MSKYGIYANIERLIAAGGGSIEPAVSQREFTTAIDTYEHLVVYGTLTYTALDGDTLVSSPVHTAFIIMSNETTTLYKKDKLLKILKPIMDNGVDNIVIVVDIQNIVKTISKLKESKDITTPIEVRPYNQFVYNLIKSVPIKYEVVSPNKIKDELLVGPSQLPKLLYRDPSCIWWRLRRGDCVQVTYPSEMLSTLQYRYVI